MTKAEMRVPVSERALLQRINRKLVSEEGNLSREVKKTRGSRAKLTLGEFYILSPKHNAVIGRDIDPEEFGRKLGVLADYEYVDKKEEK